VGKIEVMAEMLDIVQQSLGGDVRSQNVVAFVEFGVSGRDGQSSIRFSSKHSTLMKTERYIQVKKPENRLPPKKKSQKKSWRYRISRKKGLTYDTIINVRLACRPRNIPSFGRSHALHLC
jgi:hypothetical protein